MYILIKFTCLVCSLSISRLFTLSRLAVLMSTLSDSPQLHPTLSEEIPDEIINKILDELHQDPELNNIMNECEQLVEIQQLDMDVDLPDIDDRFEQELENLLG